MSKKSRSSSSETLGVVFKAGNAGLIPVSEFEDLLDSFLKRQGLGLTNGHGVDIKNGNEDIGVTVTGNLDQTIAATIAFLREKKATRQTEVRVPSQNLSLKAGGKLDVKLEAAVRAFREQICKDTTFIDLLFIEGDHSGMYPDGDAFDLLTQAIAKELGGTIWFEKWFRRNKGKLIGIRVATDADPVRAVAFLVVFLREWGTGKETLVQVCGSEQSYCVSHEHKQWGLARWP